MSDAASEAIAQTVAHTWRRIEKWFGENGPSGLSAFHPGATETEISKLETALGVVLPADFAASYRLHNGAKTEPVIALCGWQEFFPLTVIKSRWDVWKKPFDDGVFADRKSKPDSPQIRPVYWSDKWVPFTNDGCGNLLCLDLAPSESGAVGQIIQVWKEPERELIAPSFAALLTKWADDLENNEYVWDEDEGLVTAEEYEFMLEDRAENTKGEAQ